MVLIGLGLLAVTFIYVIYWYPPSRWQVTVLSDHWRWTESGWKKLPAAESKERAERGENSPTTNTGNTLADDHAAKSLEKARRTRVDGSNSTVQDVPPEGTVLNGLVPSFTLDEGHLAEKSVEDLSATLVAPTFARADQTHNQHKDSVSKSEDTRSVMPPPSRPNNQLKSSQASSSLLAPSMSPSSRLRPLPKNPNSLNPPPSTASSLRIPPSRCVGASKPTNLAVSSSTLAPSARPSKKVVLKPGHSPLDWAHITNHPPTSTFLRGISVPPILIRVTPSQVREKNGRKGRDAWGTWQGRVYNLTPYIDFHPGGPGELMRGAGKIGDAEKLFLEIHPWVNWESMLGECLIGILVGENEGIEHREKVSDLDEMD